MNQGIVLSDFHLFSSRSSFPALERAVRSELAEARTVVLNGDIFDFRWSTLDGNDQTVAAALSFLEELCESFPAAHFHFIPGNHDSFPPFIAELSRTSAEWSNFTLHQWMFRYGDALFLHGDQLHAPSGLKELELYRARFHTGERAGRLLKAGHDLLVALRIHSLFGYNLDREAACRSILQFIRNAAPHELSELRSIYFGHTHRPFENVTVEGVSFNNTGALIKGIGYRLLRF